MKASLRARGRRQIIPVELQFIRGWSSNGSVVNFGPDAFSSTEKVTLEPHEIATATVPEFLALLRQVLERSGLTAGQVSAKTSIARSSVYSLVDPRRRGLPVKAVQVQEFLCGCGLLLKQVRTVMEAWESLNGIRRRPAVKVTAGVMSKAVGASGFRFLASCCI